MAVGRSAQGSRWIRRLLVLAWFLALAGLVLVTWSGMPAWVQLLGLLAVIVTSLLLRRTAGDLAHGAFRSSYLLVVTLVVLALALGWAAADAEQIRWAPSPDQLLATLFGFTGFAAALPAAVLVWREPTPTGMPGLASGPDKEVR